MRVPKEYVQELAAFYTLLRSLHDDNVQQTMALVAGNLQPRITSMLQKMHSLAQGRGKTPPIEAVGGALTDMFVSLWKNGAVFKYKIEPAEEFDSLPEGVILYGVHVNVSPLRSELTFGWVWANVPLSQVRLNNFCYWQEKGERVYYRMPQGIEPEPPVKTDINHPPGTTTEIPKPTKTAKSSLDVPGYMPGTTTTT